LPLFGVYIIRLRVQCQAELVFRGNYGTPVSINPQTTELVLVHRHLEKFSSIAGCALLSCGLWKKAVRGLLFLVESTAGVTVTTLRY